MTIRSLAGAACAALLAASLTGCLGQEKQDPVEGSGDEVLDGAAAYLDETSGVHLTITSKGLPAGVVGLISAEGDAVKPASFEGTGMVQAFGQPAEVSLVAIEGDAWVKSAFTGPGWNPVSLADYGVPNPATILGDTGGVTDLIAKTEDVDRGEDVRCGEKNDQTCTEVTGTLSSALVALLVPSASGDSFDVTYLVDGDGRLLSTALTGEFYDGSEAMTYTITFDDYDVEKTITDPS